MYRVFIICLIVIIFLSSCRKNHESTRPVSGTIVESVYASGSIKAENAYKVYSSVSGILQKVLIKEGDTVQKGQPLFVIENSTPELNKENARLLYELARDNYQSGSDKLEEYKLAIALASEKYLNDSLLFMRQKNLRDNNIGTQVEFEQRKLAMESSFNNWKSAQSRYAQAVSQLKNDLERAKINYDISRNAQRDYIILSEINGRVYDIMPEQGEIINPQLPMAIIGSANQFLLELQVDEYDIVKVRKGQLVQVSMDSYKGKIFEAKVSRILPLMNERSRSFLVETVFSKGPDKLFQNLTVEANIITGYKNEAIIIPRSFLVDDSFVLVSPGKRLKIKPGMSNYQQVEVLQGLDTATLIYKP